MTTYNFSLVSDSTQTFQAETCPPLIPHHIFIRLAAQNNLRCMLQIAAFYCFGVKLQYQADLVEA